MRGVEVIPRRNQKLKRKEMNELHLFAGIGGGILGGQLLGHTAVCAVELEPFCRDILLRRQRDGLLPTFPIWDDVSTFDGIPWRGNVDIVAGGFPCTDISAAKRDAEGIDGKRSGLWGEMARIISEVRPPFVFVENSPFLRTRGLNVVLADLAAMGYDARWGIMGANQVGFDHLRKRLWLAAHSNHNRLQGWDGFQAPGQWEVETGSVERLREDKIRSRLPAPDAFGVANGIPSRVDRTRAVGNAQCPRMAAVAWKILTRGWV
jgi:DNA (cytosine-5)-methyltransferase 1